MGILKNLFKWAPKPQPERVTVQMGRYSDNNKSVSKTREWEDAEFFFKEGKYLESLQSFFRYLKDDSVNNVTFVKEGTNFRFEIYQGSKIIRGTGNDKTVQARVVLAKMAVPSVPVMRRLLEQNFHLYYSRYSLHKDKLFMQLESDTPSANPNKMYYALKELAVVSDKQDDLLVQDFHSVERQDSDHIENLAPSEKETRYRFFKTWIEETLDSVKKLDDEKYAGGISYLLLGAIFRIDFLITPEGRLMNELEKAQAIYFKKDGASAVEKNRGMIRALEKIVALPKDEVFRYFFRSTSCFSIRQPKSHSAVIDSIRGSQKSMEWYKENNYPDIAARIVEYALTYPQYAYSLPKPLTEMIQIFMEVNYTDYFLAIGYAYTLYDPSSKKFQIEQLEREMSSIVKRWRGKYPSLTFPREKLDYSDLLHFNISFIAMIAEINFDNKL